MFKKTVTKLTLDLIIVDCTRNTATVYVIVAVLNIVLKFDVNLIVTNCYQEWLFFNKCRGVDLGRNAHTGNFIFCSHSLRGFKDKLLIPPPALRC